MRNLLPFTTFRKYPAGLKIRITTFCRFSAVLPQIPYSAPRAFFQLCQPHGRSGPRSFPLFPQFFQHLSAFAPIPAVRFSVLHPFVYLTTFFYVKEFYLRENPAWQSGKKKRPGISGPPSFPLLTAPQG
jgi:hypothetical protein